MTLLLEATLRVSAIVLVGLAGAALLRHRSAALRHWLLGTALFGAAVAPMLRPIAPAWTVDAVRVSRMETLPRAVPRSFPREAAPRTADSRQASAGMSTAAQQPSPAEPSRADPIRAEQLVIVTWAIGAALSMLVLLAGLGRLTWLRARATRVTDASWLELVEQLSRSLGLTRTPAVLLADHPGLPATWGILRPKIVLPLVARDWPADRLRVVLLHELTHVQRADWLTQLLAEAVRAVYWFNPLVWILTRCLRQECEQACDDGVLREGVEGADYASHLLELARAATPRQSVFPQFSAPAMARPSSLERRFVAMLNERLNRTPLTRRSRLLTMAAAMLVAVAVAGLGAQSFSTFSGSVMDTTNRIVPGVTLTLVNTQTQAKYEIKSDRNGQFEFVGLPPATYKWSAALPGFNKLVGEISVAGRDVQQEMVLRMGAVAETITVKGSRSLPEPNANVRTTSESPTARPTPLPCVAGATGGVIKAPAKIHDVAPVYPVHLDASNVRGLAIVELLIDTSGNVADAKILRSTKWAELDAAAIDAVWQWRYTVTTLNCIPTEVYATVTVSFDNR